MKFSLSLLCVLSLQIPVFAETLATTTPVNRFERKSWETRHNEKIAHAKEGNIDLILLGDSITEAWERQRIYPKCFEPYTVLNLGFGGDRTQHALWRIQHGELDGISPSFVSIMLGTNNISHDEPADIAKGVEAVVRGLRKRLPETKIILLSVFPRNHPRVKGDTEEERCQMALNMLEGMYEKNVRGQHYRQNLRCTLLVDSIVEFTVLLSILI